jgi:hypothetical protein
MQCPNSEMKQPSAISLPLAAAALGLAAVSAAVLYCFDPATCAFYPVCLFHQMTGLQCPGCGSLRALHQLTHGHVAAAWHFNPLLVSLLPVGFWLALREIARLAAGWRWPGIVTRPLFGWLLLAATVVFAVARNLPLHSPP